jgi:hypothetical protein
MKIIPQKFYDDSDTLAFEGKIKIREHDGKLYKYEFKGLDREVRKVKVTANYSAGESTGLIARTIIANNCNYLYSDSDTIVNTTLSHKTEFDDKTLNECLNELADRIDGIWYTAPDGKVHMYPYTSIPDSSVSITETSGTFTSPIVRTLNKSYNYIHLYGGIQADGTYLESDGDAQDSAAIQLNGEERWVDWYENIRDTSTLTNMASAILNERHGISGPKEVRGTYLTASYLQPGNFFTLGWSSDIPEIDTAATYVIRKVNPDLKQNRCLTMMTDGLLQKTINMKYMPLEPLQFPEFFGAPEQTRPDFGQGAMQCATQLSILLGIILFFSLLSLFGGIALAR